MGIAPPSGAHARGACRTELAPVLLRPDPAVMGHASELPRREQVERNSAEHHVHLSGNAAALWMWLAGDRATYEDDWGVPSLTPFKVFCGLRSALERSARMHHHRGRHLRHLRALGPRVGCALPHPVRHPPGRGQPSTDHGLHQPAGRIRFAARGRAWQPRDPSIRVRVQVGAVRFHALALPAECWVPR